MHVLLLNAGSSSLKATLIDDATDAVVARAKADWAGASTRYERPGPDGRPLHEDVAWHGAEEATRHALRDLLALSGAAGVGGVGGVGGAGALAGVGHRIVHGGEFHESVRVTSEVRARIAALADLAPLHNPPGLQALAAAEALLPGVPHVAAFDTAFHAGLAPEASTYPLPEEWTRSWGLRRYGFHGLSHAWAAARAADMLGRAVEDLRLVTCHLGHGCSAAAVLGGRCVDTTMGFTPLDGLMMATRSGAVDPGLLLHVQQRHGLSAAEVERVLNRESGLLGVSGVSADMREVLAAAGAGNARARLALGIYAHRVRQAVGALAATLGGIDALVFTGGVGENAPAVRSASCRGLAFLGLELDEDADTRARPDADVATPGSRASILVVESREDLVMLAEVRRVVRASCPAARSTG
jgi:acetate kinase